MPNQKYVLTFDIDWAPDSSIQKCLEMLSLSNTKATFFATHHTDLNKEILLQGHELGIHPNFLQNSTQGNSVCEIIETCLSYAPEAWCMRTHALVQSSPLFHEIFSNYPQLTLDVSLFMHKSQYAPKAKWEFDGVEFDRLLYNWEDDAEFSKSNFSENAQRFFGDLTVFDFHPIHIHLNSSDGGEYKNLKNNLSGRKLNNLTDLEVSHFRNQAEGVDTFFSSIIMSDAENITLREV